MPSTRSATSRMPSSPKACTGASNVRPRWSSRAPCGSKRMGPHRCNVPTGSTRSTGIAPAPTMAAHRMGSVNIASRKGLYRRASELLREPQPQPRAVLDDAPAPQGIPPQHVVLIQGKPFVKFSGLLAMAHERGLMALTADWTFNDAELSLAHAVATFQDGRRFEESGDASPANTNRKVAVHFRRVALTRAKARVLRDALGVDLVAGEELEDE